MHHFFISHHCNILMFSKFEALLQDHLDEQLSKTHDAPITPATLASLLPPTWTAVDFNTILSSFKVRQGDCHFNLHVTQGRLYQGVIEHNISVLPRQDLSLAMYKVMQARGFAAEALIWHEDLTQFYGIVVRGPDFGPRGPQVRNLSTVDFSRLET
jgi:hypothetical protein